MEHSEIIDKLWNDYNMINPGVNRIHDLLEIRGEEIVNDHIAFRTYDIDNINIEALSTVFKKAGYVEKDSYSFDVKKLRAKHYEHHSNKYAPKIFISELITKEFSSFVQQIATEVALAVAEKYVSNEELPLLKTCWGPLSFETYEKLRTESEYAAWMYVYGFRANHFTILVNQLNTFQNIEELNAFLKENGFQLNTSGGEIKGSRQTMLKQSSTLADKIKVKFIEGEKEIPCCYYEFAERFNNKRGRLFNGFIASSADKIFESTDVKK